MSKPFDTLMIAGPVGMLVTLLIPPEGPPSGIAVICHPHPLQGGTNTHKVVQTAAKSLAQMGYICYCPNFRGVGGSAGQHDSGVGEVEDVLAVVEHAYSMQGHLPLALAGFSFGGFVAARVCERIKPDKLLLMGAAVGKYPIAIPPVPEDTLVIHGEQDDIIPLENVMAWARPQHLPVLILPGTGHFFHGRLIQLGQLIQRCW